MTKVNRLFDIIHHQKEKHNLDVAFANKEKNGEWKTYSTQDAIDQANQVSLGLLALGLKPGDKVGIISNNRPEWNFIDYGSLQIGCVDVPIYPTITEEQYTFILNHAEVKVIFVSSEELYEKIQRVIKKVEGVQAVFTFDEVEGARHWSEVKEMGKDSDLAEVEKLKANVKSSDLATLIYTSGTTGDPKGVMLSHDNIISNILASMPRVPNGAGEKCLSFLPLCHIFERMLTYLYALRCISIYYAESMDTIGDNLKEVQPHVFSTVPRLLEKVYDKIVAKGNDLTGVKKKLFFWALKLGNQYEMSGKSFWYKTQLKLANKLIFSKWREALGNNVKVIVSGAAALQPRLARVFWAAQIHVLEGYGLTETSPVIAVNYLTKGLVGFGTVGPKLDNVEVKIAEDGEICARGPNIMMGYYKNPEKTKEVIDEEGWFHTGDIGEFDSKSLLKITDRKKEMFKTSGGKYIAPQQTENKFKESTFIEQLMVVGEGEKFPAAMITPAWEVLENWCKENDISTSSRENMVNDEKIKAKYMEICQEFNKGFGHWEQIKKIELLPVEWTIEGKEMTPTLKLKRKIILEKYRDAYQRIYAK